MEGAAARPREAPAAPSYVAVAASPEDGGVAAPCPQGRPGRSCPGRPAPWAAAALALAAGACWAGGAARRGRSGGALPARTRAAGPSLTASLKEEENLPVPEGGEMEEGVEYKVEGGWFMQMDHIPNANLCMALCQAQPKCDTFTWVKDALDDGCPSQCWLKGGEPSYTEEKKGVVSGRPPPRRALPKLPVAKGGPTLFCWALTMPEGNEPDLLRWQAERNAGPFACEEVALYSKEEVDIGCYKTRVIESDMKCKNGGDSGTALNSWIFIAAWLAVVEDGDYKKADWTVKADPDAVFFADRLKAVVSNYEGTGYLSNCKFGLHGPIEVFSRAAIEALHEDYQKSWDKKSPGSCVEGLHFEEWGEDMFIDQCLNKVLKVGEPPVEPMLMCEDHCDCKGWWWCPASDSQRVSFHPFKSPEDYKNCLANALDGPLASEADDVKPDGDSCGQGGGGNDDAEDEDEDDAAEEDNAEASSTSVSREAGSAAKISNAARHDPRRGSIHHHRKGSGSSGAVACGYR
ncbi:unnamed protein product [Prorocentrum cordatum]|uniref:Apple domain-containing protein n=1 Tax=Prorocentrum cordatum TaxID=2364126 RepID=A0ABN9Y5X1_9DINO|nr:unnamed protein product [Polarella glacialis]